MSVKRTGPAKKTVAEDLKRRLRESRDRIDDLLRTQESIFSTSREGIMMLDRRGRVVAVNTAFCEMTGVSQDEMVGQTGVSLARRFLKLKDLPRILGIIAAIVRGNAPPVYEVEYRGRIFEVHNPKHVRGSGVMAAYFNDITERKRAEFALRASEAKISGIFRAAPVGIGLATGGRLTEVNDRFCQLSGYSRAELMGISPQDLFAGAADYEAVARLYRSQQAAGSGPFEVRWKRRDGRTLDLLVSGAAIDPGNPTFGQCVGILEITDFKRTEDALIKAQRLESVSFLAGGLAHDFNNLLTGLFGYIDLARMSASDPETRKFLDKSMAVLSRTQDMARQLMAFSKGGKPVRTTIDLALAVKETVYFVLSGSAIKADFVVDPGLWACEADENQIRQAIDNIVINARQAMPGGGRLKISLRNLEAGASLPSGLESGRYIRIAIEDQGPGIPREIQPRVFDPFFTTRKEGNGLGLAIAYSILRKHGGDIILESPPGRGATFNLFLPASTEAISVVEDKEPVSHSGEGRILLMDDDPGVRDIAANMLGSMGYGVVTAEDGERAVELFDEARASEEPFDIVILDLTVAGGMSGREAIMRIRKTSPSVLAVVSSGYADDPVMADPAGYGFDAALTKPYNLSRMGQVLETLVFGRLRSSRNR